MPLTLKNFVSYLRPSTTSVDQCPIWPADVFALTMAVLEKSGAYTLIGTEICLLEREDNWKDYLDRADAMIEVGRGWRARWIKHHSSDPHLCLPPIVRAWWSVFRKAIRSGIRVNQIRDDPALCAALINLAAAADEAMAGAGLYRPREDEDTYEFWAKADVLLLTGNASSSEGEFGSTLCDELCPSCLRVLPKAQTPQSGLSLRSLSHYLSLCPPLNIRADWHVFGVPPVGETPDCCNVLLIPFPYKLDPVCFVEVEVDHVTSPVSSKYLSQGNIGWFGLKHEEDPFDELFSRVKSIVSDAKRLVSSVDMVVLPELALTKPQFNRLREELSRNEVHGPLISGVSERSEKVIPENQAIISLEVIGTSEPYSEFVQGKHHPWKLDADQIIRYGLASKLDPNVSWWEALQIPERQINFFAMQPWLTTCVLICEDLAQYDPMGRFVRNVAPDLVIALLMDGPQLDTRWPARYATVLADDPGSAVLTLTSLGMTQLSSLPEASAAPVPRTIGLWKDPIRGTIPIQLPPGKQSAVLTIRPEDSNEYSADGRSKSLDAGSPVFSGVHYLD